MASINGSYFAPSSWKRRVFLWEMVILFWVLTGKIKKVEVLSEFTTWKLPNNFELQYTDYSHDWGISREDEINHPFRTNYINSVYCKKGPIYVLFRVYMRMKAAELRSIGNWRKLETIRREREGKPTSEHQAPALGVQTDVRDRRRLLNIIIERKCSKEEYFSLHVVAALREYADVIEYQATYGEYADPETIKRQEAKGLGHNMHKFKSSNECYIRVIAGTEYD